MHKVEILLKGTTKQTDRLYNKIVKEADATQFLGRFSTLDERQTTDGYYMKFVATQEVYELLSALEVKGKVEFVF